MSTFAQKRCERFWNENSFLLLPLGSRIEQWMDEGNGDDLLLMAEHLYHYQQLCLSRLAITAMLQASSTQCVN